MVFISVFSQIVQAIIPTFLIDEEKIMLYIRSTYTYIFQLENDENLNVIKKTYSKRN